MAINCRLLFRKLISSFLAASCLTAQYKTYGERACARSLMICELDANHIHERKRPLYAKLYSHALKNLSSGPSQIMLNALNSSGHVYTQNGCHEIYSVL